MAHATIDVFVSGWTFGFFNSVHCACMCGPLTLLLDRSAPSVIAYHGSRTVTYVALGAAVGSLGLLAHRESTMLAGAWTGIVFGAFLLLRGLGLKFNMSLSASSSLAGKLMQSSRRQSPIRRAVTLGAATPLLPCGLLWLALAGSASAGSSAAGAVSMTGFALGYAPALIAAQVSGAWARTHLSSRRTRLVTLVGTWIAGAVLIWRGVLALQDPVRSCCS